MPGEGIYGGGVTELLEGAGVFFALLGLGELPNPDAAVFAGGGDQGGVGRPGDGGDTFAVGDEHVDLFGAAGACEQGGDIPDADGFVFTAGDEAGAIGRPRDASDCARVPGEVGKDVEVKLA